MTTLTNVLRLPAPLVAALSRDDYDREDADFTVTELLAPPRMMALVRAHADEITEDASERIYALLGTCVHEILARANASDLGEERLFMELAGKRIGGKPDHFALADGILSDYKVASVWEWIYGTKPEREQQLNCYAELLRANGREVKGLQNVMIFRDWSKTKASQEDNYPQRQVAVVEQPLWSQERAREFLHQRVAFHLDARLELPDCTPEERWAKPDTWAVMKDGRKSALRVLGSQEEAERWRKENAPAARIEHRPGQSTRCLSYCAAGGDTGFCSQWEKIRNPDGLAVLG